MNELRRWGWGMFPERWEDFKKDDIRRYSTTTWIFGFVTGLAFMGVIALLWGR